MATLTDRYTWAVTRLLPDEQRPEIDRELRSLIGDMIEDRPEADADPDAAEREALVELGDPSHLAARYVERPRALIGPEVFPEYLRMLKLVAAVVVPLVAVLGALGRALDGDADAGVVVGTGLGAAFSAAVQVAFWVTLAYAFADRWKRSEEWTPDSLPDPPAPSLVSRGETLASLAVVVVTIGVLVGQHVRPLLTDDAGVRVPFLHPDLWAGPAFVLVGLLAAAGALVVVVHRAGRWTLRLAAVNVALDLALLGVVAWLSLGDRLLNPRFFEVVAQRAEWDTVPEVNPWIPVLLVAAALVGDVVDCTRKALRAGAQKDG